MMMKATFRKCGFLFAEITANTKTIDTLAGLSK
jgi:hypothetical protein